MLDLICVGYTSTEAFTLIDGIKIKWIEVWAPFGAGPLGNTVTLDFRNTETIGCSGSYLNDTAMSTADIAHVCSKPPPGSLADLWIGHNLTEQALFSLDIPNGAVIDVLCDVSIRTVDDPETVVGTVTGAVPGKVYYRYLDSTGAQVLVPTGGNPI